MPIASNVTRRAGTYQYRVRVPRNLVARFGRSELKRSLRTTDPAVAKRRALVAGRIALGLFDWARRDLMLSRQEIEAATRAFYASQLEEDRLARIRSSRLSAGPCEPPTDRDSAVAEARRQLATLDFDEIEPVAAKWTLANGHTFDPDSRAHQLLCEYFLRARLEAARRAAEADQGIRYGQPQDPLFAGYDPVTQSFTGAEPAAAEAPLATAGSAAVHPTPPADAAPAASAPATPAKIIVPASDSVVSRAVTEQVARHVMAKKHMTITQLAEAVIAEYRIDRVVPLNPDGTPGQCRKTQAADYRRSARALEEFIGPKPVREITNDEIVAFKDFLLKLPKHIFQAEEDGILAAVDANERRIQNGETPRPTISAVRINSGYLSPLRVMLDYAKDNGAITANPVVGVRAGAKRTAKRRKQRARLPFSTAQLNEILAAPLYTGCVSSHYWHDRVDPSEAPSQAPVYLRSYRFWVPLIMLLMGCRPEEIGQLEVGDLKSVNGWPCLVVANLSGDEDKSDTQEITDVHGKSPAAHRELPIHPILIALGLLDRIEESRRAGALRVFPEWKVVASGTYSDRVSKEFNAENRFFDRIGLKSAKRMLYSLRHNHKDALRDAGIGEEAQDYLMGHENERVSRLYGSQKLRGAMIDSYLAADWYAGLEFRQILDGPDEPAIKIGRIPAALRAKLVALGIRQVGGVPLSSDRETAGAASSKCAARFAAEETCVAA